MNQNNARNYLQDGQYSSSQQRDMYPYNAGGYMQNTGYPGQNDQMPYPQVRQPREPFGRQMTGVVGHGGMPAYPYAGHHVHSGGHRRQSSQGHPQFIPTRAEMSTHPSGYGQSSGHDMQDYNNVAPSRRVHPYSPGHRNDPTAYPPPPPLQVSVPVTNQPLVPPTSPTSPTSGGSNGERFPCNHCSKTFSRSHDRKRHYETAHSPNPVVHQCQTCKREFSRGDSLKRHVDNGCQCERAV